MISIVRPSQKIRKCFCLADAVSFKLVFAVERESSASVFQSVPGLRDYSNRAVLAPHCHCDKAADLQGRREREGKTTTAFKKKETAPTET